MDGKHETVLDEGRQVGPEVQVRDHLNTSLLLELPVVDDAASQVDSDEARDDDQDDRPSRETALGR